MNLSCLFLVDKLFNKQKNDHSVYYMQLASEMTFTINYIDISHFFPIVSSSDFSFFTIEL